MNSDSLAAFLSDRSGFDGGASELYTALTRHNNFRLLPDLPASGEDFLIELRRQVPELKARGVEVVLSPHGGVQILTPLERREGRISDNLLRAQWRDNPQLRREFSSFETYAAYEKANAAGRAHSVVGNKANQGSQSSEAPHSDVDPRLPLEEQCRQRWAIEPATRAEFRDNYAAFLNYEKANAKGQARVFRAG
jgi:hypothetical protein